MSQVNPDIENLWHLALQEAGFTADDVILVVADAPRVPEQDSASIYWSPGADPSGTAMPLDPDDLARIVHAPGRGRVGVYGRLGTPELLGVLRWALALAEQEKDDPGLYDFAWRVLDSALSNAYTKSGKGGGVIHNLNPSVRDANFVASELVRRTQGEQFGRLQSEWGPVFRKDIDYGGQKTLARRIVVFTALHQQWLDPVLSRQDIARLLSRATPHGPSWWETLTGDPDFGHFQGVIPHLIPSQMEIEKAGAAPATAWLLLAQVLERGLSYGLRLIE